MNDEKSILAIDIGTTKVKAGLIDIKGFRVVTKTVEDAIIDIPRHGWAEVEPDTLWDQVCRLSTNIASKREAEILGLVFSGHMAGVVPVDKEGNPLRKLIIWLDARASGYPRGLWSGLLRIKGYNLVRLLEHLYITGGAPGRTGKDPLSKILWIRDNEPDVWSKTFKVLGTNGFLILKASGYHVSSPDDAALTWLLDTRSFNFKWNQRLLRRYGLEASIFPTIMESTDIVGRLRNEASKCMGLREQTPVITGSGDLTSAAIGSGAIGEGDIHVYIGTSDWVAAHIRKRKLDLFNYIGSIPSGIPGYYLLVAEQEIAGGALDNVLDLLGLSGMYDEAMKMAKESTIGSGGLLFTPWLYGERAPVDDPNIRGSLLNISLTSTRGDVIRAVLEGVAFNIKWVYSMVERMTKKQEAVNIVGGGAQSDLWCKIVASAIKRNVRRVADPQDATLRGAATIASVGLGLTNFQDATSRFAIEKVFQPEDGMARYYDKLFKIYTRAYRTLRDLLGALVY